MGQEFRAWRVSPPLGMTHTPPRGFCGAEEILPMAPWESRCLRLPWSSPSHCQVPWEPCGQGTTAISVTTSQPRLCQGPSHH